MKAIKYYTLFILIVFFSNIKLAAAAINCEVADVYRAWATIDSPFELNVGQVNAARNVKITVGSGINDYTVLHTVSMVNIGNTSATCTSSTYLYYTIFDPQNGAALRTIGNDVIYPTSVPGIGISVTSALQSNAAVPLYPATLLWAGTSNGLGLWVTVKIWKTPGALPASVGLISFSGPTVGQVLMYYGDTFTSSDASRLWDGGRGWIASSRRLRGTLMLQPSTCELVMPNAIVDMGTFFASPVPSGWKDASFNLSCPNAWGYGGGTVSNNSYTEPNNVAANSTVTANTFQNNALRIQVVPRTQIVDAINGIVAFNAGGAEGYGLQLAWGDSATLGSGTPTRPVQFNTWTLANSLNSAYRTSAYAFGAPAISAGADGTIKMAARYIRTSGRIQPGPANAAVEIIANYQ